MANDASQSGLRQRRLVVAIEHHFVEVEGRIYTALAFGYEYWKEYLDVFGEVEVLGRVGRADVAPDDHFRADGPGVRFLPVPDYLGPGQFFLRFPGVVWAAWTAARRDAVFLLRSGNICNVLWILLLLLGKPYAREVQGALREAIVEFTRARRPVLGRLFAEVSERLARVQLWRAANASYVSHFCRQRYPTRHRDREHVFSSVRIDDQLARPPRPASAFDRRPLRIVSIGRLELEKGHHVLLEAARILRDRQPDGWRLTVVGPGRELERLRARVCEYGLTGQVEFAGPAPYGPELFAYLDAADVFVLPSLTEGMPRSLIEAMARGLPAVASRVGGVVELLPDDQMVDPGQPEQLAQALAERLRDPERLARDSERNHRKAIDDYGVEVMRRRIRAFWQAVHDQGERRRAA